ncbi:MAG TPA: dTDP-glucose 4,6-dehydratase [Chloroflexota bacterium]|nr:dTDP-glucose 4,6-dehydratase [Chloroflexota bacterium]
MSGVRHLLVTGGAGFIGSNFVRYWLERHPDDLVVNLDLLTYAGNLANLADLPGDQEARYRFVRGDIRNQELVEHILAEFKIDVIVNFAAESHNSRAVLDPALFLRTNVLGAQSLLEAARRRGIGRFHHVSTCEIYGDLALDSPESFHEDTPYRPRTPYNASKAATDHVVRSYFETFHVPITISVCANNYGPYQFPEKVIPLFTTNALQGKPLPLYRHSQNRREWIHAVDHCSGIERILDAGRVGETYHVGTGVEKSVEEIADGILGVLNLPTSLKTYVEDRPGHDRRYLLDSSKIRRELGWKPTVAFEEGLPETIRWYQANPSWWQPLLERASVEETRWK